MTHRISKAVAVVAIFFLTEATGCREASKPTSSTAGTATSVESGPKLEPPTGISAVNFKLTSTAFKDGEPIPKKYAGEGEDVSPPLAWEGAPAGTQEFVLICDDPDARSKNPWVHWVIYCIGPEVRALPENLQSGVEELDEPIAAKQGENFFDEGNILGWRGPMPPVGRGTHHYNFKLYALDKRLDVPPKATKPQLLEAMQGHVLGEAVLIGTYERK